MRPCQAARPGKRRAPEWPDVLGGISLEVRDAAGGSRRAPLLYVSERQINFLVPEDTAIGEAALMVVRGSVTTQAGTLQVEDVAPGIFLVNPVSLTPFAYDVRADAGGLSTTTPAFQCSSPAGCEPVSIASSGSSSWLVFFGTGFRNATSPNVKCAIRSLPLDVEFAGPSGVRGMQEIRVRVPPEEWDFWDMADGSVHLSIDGIVANMAWMVFTNPPRESRW